jgi:CheY-like chemotaxis protein
LLAFARRQPLNPEACDLNELIRVGEPLIRRALRDEQTLHLRLCTEQAVALIDPAQFEGALLNLVVNAVDASAAGGRISVETNLRDLSAGEFPDLEPGRYFCLRITDSGQGMSPQVMSRIFEPFFTTKPTDKGTGLGLSQVYGFVRQSGGEVRVQSKEGQGTTFTLYLPIVDRAVDASPEQEPTLRKSIKRLSILLAEDNASVATVTEMMLKNLGHVVTHAENAEQALRILRSQQQLDLLLSDIVMPGGMNGLELAHQAAAIRPGLQILLSSGYAGEAADQAIAQGAWPFLKKPYLQDELAEHLQRFTQQVEAND